MVEYQWHFKREEWVYQMIPCTICNEDKRTTLEVWMNDIEDKQDAVIALSICRECLTKMMGEFQ